jgi:hypothetical protein
VQALEQNFVLSWVTLMRKEQLSYLGAFLVFRFNVLIKCLLCELYTVAYFVRQYASSPKVAGSIPNGIIGFFSCTNPSSRSMPLGTNQPPAEIVSGIFLEVKAGRILTLTTAENLEASSYQWASTACHRDGFFFFFSAART